MISRNRGSGFVARCGEARYCDEALARALARAPGPCLENIPEQAKERRSRWDPHGKTIEKVRRSGIPDDGLL